MNAKTCPLCHTSIPEHAPGGLCPACVLRGADETPEPANGPTVEEVASAFPKLEILRLIGHGGMGYVYQARQPELDRMVALKILSPSLRSDPAFEERFAREARVLGKLKHPNIVTLYEHGESGGYFYLMMEFVDGVNLRQAMSAGRFSPEQALAIVPAICDALQSAHAQGVWHRDIKPENILLDKDGRVKIADFGIARILGDPERNFTLTRTGGQLGSAAYMAPEQHEKPHSVDHRADIYSLGVVIYEMLTGELPLGRFPLPSQRAEVGKRIDEIVLRTLEKERELRQQSAGEVKTEVENVASDFSRSLAAEKNGLKSGTTLQTSRFSRTALAGAVWLGIALFGLLVDAGPNGHGDSWSTALLTLAIELPMLSAPIGVTILGWIAVSQIRRSEGKLHGTWLAVFDGLFFPLLALAVAVWWFWRWVIDFIGDAIKADGPPWGVWTRPFLSVTQIPITVSLLCIVTFGIAAIFIIRRVWRAVNAGLLPGSSGRESAQTESECTQASQSRLTSAATNQEPRFSRTAVVGASLIILPFAIGTIGPALTGPIAYSDRAGMAFVGICQVLALAMAIASTILGWIAVSQIRRSEGKLHGMWLAVFDGLFFPLLALDAGIFLLLGNAWRTYGQFADVSRPFDAFLLNHDLGKLCLFLLSPVICVIVDWLIIRRVWRAVSRPLAGEMPAGAPRPLNRVAIAAAFVAMIAGIFGVMMWVASPTGPSVSAAEFTAPVTVHCRVFEAEATRADKLVSPDTRVRGDEREKQPGEVRSGTPPNAVSQTAEISASALTSLLAGISKDHPMLSDYRREVPIWPRLADGGGWSVGSVGGFVGVRRVNGNLQLRLEYSVSHSIPNAGFAEAEIFYKGDAPKPGDARAFFVPFTESGVEKYLVVAFEIEAEAKADAQKLSFGPVMERLLPLEPNGSAYIDFQTGNILNKQWKLEDAIQDEKVTAWMKSTGADANAYLLTEADAPIVEPRDPSDLWPRLIGTHGGCTFVLARNETFESAHAEDADSRLKEIPGRNIVQEYAIGPQPYWFKTGDGVKGIVQIHSLTSNPRAAQIRYKLVQNATSPTTDDPSIAIVKELSGKISDWLNERGVTMDGLRFERAPGSDSRVFASYTGRKSTGEIGDTQGQVLLNFTAPNQWTLYGMGEFGGKNAEWHLENSGWPDQWPGLSFDEFRRMVETTAEAANASAQANPQKPISPEAVAAYRELREFLLSKQPREFMDPDVRQKWGELGKRFTDSLRGTAAEPLWTKAVQLMEDSQRASAKGNDAEEQRLRKEADEIEKEIQAMLEQAGAPKYPDENSAASSKPPVSKAAGTPSEQLSSAPAGFGLQGTRTFSPESANRDGVIGYRFSDNDEVAVPDTVTGHFRDVSKAGFTPELKQWMRDNRVDLLLHLAEKTYDVLTLDMLDRFVGEPLTWGDVTPEELEQALKRCGDSGGTPGSGMTSGRGYTSGPTDVNLFRTRDGATGCYQISASSNVVGRRVVIQSKLIPPRKGMAAARLLPGSEFSRAVADPADHQSQCLVSLDAGTVSALPEELKTKLDVQNPRETDETFIAWMRERRADAVARFIVTDGKVVKFGLRTFGLIAIPLHEGTPEQITPEEAEKRLDQSLTEWGFIPEVNDLMTDPGKPVAFLVQNRSGRRGLLRITGVEEHPRGVNVHFMLTRTGRGDHPAQATAIPMIEADDDSPLNEQPPVVVGTFPVSGARDVAPGETEIRVRFSKPMSDAGWSWCVAWENSTPEAIGRPHYEADGKTCVLKVKLEAGRTYAYWLNHAESRNFTSSAGQAAVPYLLIFQTRKP